MKKIFTIVAIACCAIGLVSCNGRTAKEGEVVIKKTL